MRSSEPGLARKVETKRAWVVERTGACVLFEAIETNFGDRGLRGAWGRVADTKLIVRGRVDKTCARKVTSATSKE